MLKLLLVTGSVILFSLAAVASESEGERISGLDDVPIPHSSWVIQNRIMGSPSPINGGGWLNVTARNNVTGKHILILSISDIQTPLQESFNTPNHFIITLPNRTDILEQHDRFSDFTVTYHYTPKDDPADRAAYQFWWRHPKDNKAVEWCLNNLSVREICSR